MLAITGAASGLGAALYRRATDRGQDVIGVDLSGTDVDADLSTAEGRGAAVDALLDRCGGELGGLAVCAGIGPPSDPVRTVSVNYFGAIEVLDALEPALAAGAPSAALAISSNSITLVEPDQAVLRACLTGDEGAARSAAAGLDSTVAYATTKRAVAIAVRERAVALGPRQVRVNAVAPGPFASGVLQHTLSDPVLAPLVDALPSPAGRRGTVDEVAAAAEFLLSPEAAYVTGSLLFVDGGTDAAVAPHRAP